MLLPRREDAVHKGWLLRLLAAICDDTLLASHLAFKGGTCAAMRGFLNRFSIDLDFDLIGSSEKMTSFTKACEEIFKRLGLEVKDKSAQTLQYFIRYPASNSRERNTIKIDSSFPVPRNNTYEIVRLPEIDRVINCQTLETLVAHKLVTLMARYERTGKIAGRDLFDVHHFLFHGYPYRKEIILELSQGSLSAFFKDLIDFVEKHVTSTLIDQDLNYLLPYSTFQSVRKILKTETLALLRAELERVTVS